MGSHRRFGGRPSLLRVVLFAVAVALLWSIAPVAGATPDPCTGICRTAAKGKTAFAWLSTVPQTGPVPGVFYTDVEIDAGLLTLGPGRPASGRFADIYIAKYRYDAEGNPDFVSIALGSPEGSAVSISFAPRLATATLVASIRLTRCQVIDYEPVCTQDPSASTLREMWTAIAPTLYEDSRAHLRTGGLNIVLSFNGSRRLATSQATLNGRSLGTFLGASINDQKSHSLLVNHTGIPLG